ncbi:uncharacterized protein LOC124950438 isoform X1 [Vespa velutina]|uniref:uncharacterized protein LOC124950438 isoform X1 n=1 Tax=Vespa velutina TaxID=202808 RepID=UPI001FB3CC11|nr:uncharacterized protein LOC124950438 isoform X1 [Vespa velutina]XP_047353074.1 uncharacterized protein LOC124950438 isoform X1 [Vespa velutina]
MGNNGSSHQQCPSNGLSQDMARGWTQTFPRELSKHHSQPPGHKVLPEPPNQRLRATNNGSIIHNGGTISGRRPSAQTLPHDLNKQGVFRSRSTSASNIGVSRSRKSDHHCCHYQSDSHCMDNEMQELKRFGSEPDLRYSPTERCNTTSRQHHGLERRHCTGYYPERDSRERESRYKGKKKYKAPAPPGNVMADGSSPDSYKWELGQDNSRCRHEEEVQPPPRRSRLFKTRAETKRAQISWMPNLSTQSHQERNEATLENERRWRNERSSISENKRPSWREQDQQQQPQQSQSQQHQQQQQQQQQQDRWCRDELRRSKRFDGKNTLQRSMSSPEFQAELMQVARKVRNKLNCGRKSASPLDSCNVASLERKNVEPSKSTKEKLINEEHKKTEKKNSKTTTVEERTVEDRIVSRMNEERRLIVERCSRMENKMTSYEERRNDVGRSKDCSKEREDNGVVNKKRNVERSTNFEDEATNQGKKPLKERLDTLGHSIEDRFSDKQRRDFEDYQRSNDPAKNQKFEDVVDTGRSRSESPIRHRSRDKFNARGQGSGRESTPEPQEHKGRDKENSDPKWCKREIKMNDTKNIEKRWSDGEILIEKKDPNAKDKLTKISETKEPVENWHILPRTEKSTPKTFYFGMDEALSKESRNSVDQQIHHIQSRLQVREINRSNEYIMDDGDEIKSGPEDISLKLRPTLPKKQLEIPRFSPSAAWRLLSALEAPGPTMSTASEEIPVMFEERIERLSRPPPPLIALGPRSSHDKSGDSGISGDAGAGNDDSLDVSTMNRIKTPATRPTWTPQQDLGEESSSDAGVDSPPPIPAPLKFTPKAHVFSLSLPRDDNRMYLYNPEAKGKEGSAFNSLQKLKRSMSGAFGLGPLDLERKRASDVLDDNWLLSSSAPTSLQLNQITDVTRSSPSGWKQDFDDEDVDGDDDDDDQEDSEDRNDFPVIMKPPSFSYLASGGHVMYLPEANGTVYQPQNLNYKNKGPIKKQNFVNSASKYKKNVVDDLKKSSMIEEKSRKSKNLRSFGERSSFAERGINSHNRFSNFSKSCENISEMKQRSTSPTVEQSQNVQDNKESSSEIKAPAKHNSKSKRFTFQSTVRQIERRRLAEKLSREAEAKERQRKGELEAMRKVEEEFQRKRAREKANIRQQLRLYNMDEHLSSLPSAWDTSQLSRADPDGAPSSSASSPTSAPLGTLTANRKNSVSSDEHHRKRGASSESKQQQKREYKDYRPKYYAWTPENSSHLEYKQTTVHPKVICDIPKSSAVFVDANVHGGKATNLNSTPRSDNYRKDFAHGAVAARSSLASSDSELSQPNTRPHSRQTGGKGKPLRSRSASPERSEEAASSEDESPVEPIKQERNPINGFILNGVQPFVREKSYRPISFNPQPPQPIPS